MNKTFACGKSNKQLIINWYNQIEAVTGIIE